MAYDSIKKYEAFRDKAYQDQVGKWTIGYGQTQIGGRPVQPGDVLSREQADKEWGAQVAPYAAAVKAGLRVPVNAAQDEALTSFAYNHGTKSPRLRVLLDAVNNGGDVQSAFLAGNTAGGKYNEGLANRRAAEWAMYSGGGNVPGKSPSPLQSPEQGAAGVNTGYMGFGAGQYPPVPVRNYHGFEQPVIATSEPPRPIVMFTQRPPEDGDA